MAYYPHPYNPSNKSKIIREWTEERFTKCPIDNSTVSPIKYIGYYVEYEYVNKKGKKIHIPEYCLRVEWL